VAYLGGQAKSCVVNKFKLPSLKIACPGDEWPPKITLPYRFHLWKQIVALVEAVDEVLGHTSYLELSVKTSFMRWRTSEFLLICQISPVCTLSNRFDLSSSIHWAL
jgi:hypothetical protein